MTKKKKKKIKNACSLISHSKNPISLFGVRNVATRAFSLESNRPFPLKSITTKKNKKNGISAFEYKFISLSLIIIIIFHLKKFVILSVSAFESSNPSTVRLIEA